MKIIANKDAEHFLFRLHIYCLFQKTGLIDYDKLEESAKLFLPKLIVAGFSAYSRKVDFERIKKVFIISPTPTNQT